MANKWIKYKLIRRPWVDGEGKVLESIEGRQNRPGIDEFSGGGYDYPSELGKIDRFEHKGNLMLLVDENDINPMLLANEKFNGIVLSDPLQQMKNLGLTKKATLDNNMKIIWPKIEGLNNG